MTTLRIPWKQLVGLLATASMLLAMLAVPASPVVAQDGDNTYEFSSGQVLSWTGAWQIEPESSTIENGLELVLLSQSLSFLAVMSVPAGLDVDSTRDAFLEGFLGAGEESVTIDRGSYGAVSYSLDTIRYDQVNMGVFTLFRTSSSGGETFAWIFVSLVDTFAAEFAAAQNAFTLDGNPPFTGIEGQGLQDQLQAAVASGNVPDDEGNDPTPEADETPEVTTPDGGDTGNGGGGLKGGGSTPTEETGEPTAEVEDPTPDTGDTPSGEVGLVDDSTYISPAYGNTVEWDANFTLNPNRDPNPSASTNGLESVGLSSTIEGAPAFVLVSISPTTVSAMDYADVWSSDDYLTENAISPEAEILLVEGTDEVSAVVMVDYLEDGTPLIFYYEFRVDAASGTLVMLQYYTAAALVPDTLPLAQSGVTVDGEESFTFFTVPEVVEAAAGV